MTGSGEKLPRAFNDRDEYASPEQRLMQAVLINAIRDACGVSADTLPSSPIAALNQSRALDWIASGDKDFQEVCHHAGLEPDTVRTHTLAFIESGQPIPRVPVGGGGRKKQPLSAPSIAARAGCSTSTVRQILRDGGGSPSLQKRVHTAVAEIQKELAA